MDAPALQPLPLLPTGQPGLDAVLGGGLRRGGMYVVLGGHGAGKTVLSNQLAFARAAEGEQAVVVSMLAESHGRMLQHLSGFSFFEPSWVPGRVTYLSGVGALEEAGLDGLAALLQRAVRERRASLLVLDALSTVVELAPSTLALKHFLRKLGALCDLTGCVALLVGPPTLEGNEAVLAAPDGMLRLASRPTGMRTVRELEVVKLRGAAFLEGRHHYTIGPDGLAVHPRIEALLADAPGDQPVDHARLPVGIPALDAMLRGGVAAGSSTVLLGAPGAGKTLLGTHFLAEGAARGERGLFFGLYETPPRLVAKMEGIGVALQPHVEAGRLALLWQPAQEHLLDVLVERLLGAVHQHRPARLFIDGADGFVQGAAEPARVARVFSALTQELRRLDVTTLITQEAALFGEDLRLAGLGLSATFESILFLRQVEVRSRLRRLLSIVKVRESDYDADVREFRITARGIQMGAPLRGADALLSGQARSPPRGKAKRAPARGKARRAPARGKRGGPR